MVQSWKSLSLIYYKYLKYIVADYALISALSHYCVLRKNTCPLSQ